MTSTQDLLFVAVARKTPKRKDKRQKKKRTCKIGKKRLHIFLDESKNVVNGWKEVPELWTFGTCESYIELCHIGRGFPHDRFKKQCKADKANLHFC
jgi:hypothetical protein